MNVFIGYIKDYLRNTDLGLLILTLCFVAVIIFLNYRYGIETKILYNISNRIARFGGFYLLYLLAFATPYLLQFLISGKQVHDWKLFLVLLLVSPAIFSLKVNFSGLVQWIQSTYPGPWGRYWATLANLPSRLILVAIPIAIIWWLGKYDNAFFGFSYAGFSWKPYLLMLLIMVPLIAFASTQSDFLSAYPKLKQVAFIDAHSSNSWLYKLFYEISYGIDFVTIELFFRGFLVLAFVRFVGPAAILPMAVFYCSIHFGKPLFECISSFFGGILLGLVVYHTKSIYGGLVVHLGIAWLMEAGALLGNYLRK